MQEKLDSAMKEDQGARPGKQVIRWKWEVLRLWRGVERSAKMVTQ